MTILGLGYITVKSDKLDDWTNYSSSYLGMQVVDKTKSTAILRMDDRKQRFVITNETKAENIFGWEVNNKKGLDEIANRLDNVDIKVKIEPKSIADQRYVKELISFSDPLGNRLEVFYGAETTTEKFIPGRNISGFRTGLLGMGHIVLNVKKIDDAQWFYSDVLGFRLSDYMVRPFKAYFFHANPRHHSIAFIETGENKIHHLMVEVFMLDDVGQCYDLANAEQDRIATTFGRHINDNMTSFYSYTPSNFLFEYGWGGRTIDQENWEIEEVKHGPSLWGHDRLWMPPDQLKEARRVRSTAVQDNMRIPVNVMPGNFNLGVGQCPWWQKTKN
tara:strand:- start:144 stop:1136 length:993 start_codon:yes stop_codon:yes gene_type:complete